MNFWVDMILVKLERLRTMRQELYQIPLRPLCKNEYFIKDMQKFPPMISSVPTSQDDEKVVSYNGKSLFTNLLNKFMFIKS